VKLLHVVDSIDVSKEIYKLLKIKLSVLISYVYLKGKTTQFTGDNRDLIDLLYLDSGTYTAQKSKIDLTVDEYLNFLDYSGHLFDQYFNFDDQFENPDHNEENQLYLVEQLPASAKRPIPVLHDEKNPIDELESYIDMGYDDIAIGSNVRARSKVLDTANTKYPKKRLHVFGSHALKMLETFKPYTADSATYIRQASTNMIYFWDWQTKKTRYVYVGGKDRNMSSNMVHFNVLYQQNAGFKTLMGKLGYDHKILFNSWMARWIVNLYFFTEFESYVNSLP